MVEALLETFINLYKLLKPEPFICSTVRCSISKFQFEYQIFDSLFDSSLLSSNYLLYLVLHQVSSDINSDAAICGV